MKAVWENIIFLSHETLLDKNKMGRKQPTHLMLKDLGNLTFGRYISALAIRIHYLDELLTNDQTQRVPDSCHPV